jgi:acyl carrier protein
LDQLTSIVARVFDIPLDQVNDSLERGKLEAWDSLNHLLLINEIEDELKVQFTTKEVIEINTLKDLRQILSTKK